MKPMPKGEAFEDTVYDLLKRQIDEDRFWARRECCRLFRKKHYHSKDRGKDIVFDVAIEITLPGMNSYSLLVLVECKNYSGSVPVDDIEEFWAKIEQVAGANVKGIVASTTGFQEGGLRFAASKGLAILRYLGHGDFKWVLTRSASWSGSDSRSESPEVRAALTSHSVVSRYYDYCFAMNETYTYSSNRMFEALCAHSGSAAHAEFVARVSNPRRQGRPTVPYVEKEDIEQVAIACLEEIGYRDGVVGLEAICEWQRGQSGLLVTFDRTLAAANGTLGTLSFDPVQICLFQDTNAARVRFTLAHELGHLLLNHKAFLLRESTQDSDLQSDAYTALDYVDLRRLEWQANFFSSCLLLPFARFAAHFAAIAQSRDLRDRGFGILYVDYQPVNIGNFLAVTNYLSESFNVSRQVTIIRLKELGYLNDVRTKSGLRRLVGPNDDV